MKRNEISRREFLSRAGKGAAAAAILSACPPLRALASDGDTPDAPAYPFTWHELDIDAVQKRTYQAFYDKGGCARAVFDGIMGTLADEYGYPYNQIPSEMYNNGHAGFTAGSYCGSLGGASGVLGLFINPQDVDPVLGELQSWYSSSHLPIYQPDKELITTVSDSVNCVDSVGTWMKAAGITDRSDPDRLARCAGVSADVAKKTIELINIYYGLAEAPAESVSEKAAEALADNEYLGTAKGMDGDVTVKVTVDDGKISAVEVISQNETKGIGTNAIEQLPEQFVGLSSPEEIDAIDGVSGATVTSDALKEAVKAALSQAGL